MNEPRRLKKTTQEKKVTIEEIPLGSTKPKEAETKEQFQKRMGVNQPSNLVVKVRGGTR